MSKVLDSILKLKDTMSDDWSAELSRINIYGDVKFIYSKRWPTQFCNSVIAFVVLAYDNQSGWIDIHKDRWTNKYRIAERLGMDIKSDSVIEIVENDNYDVNQLVAWFMEYQADWRWDAIITCFEYAAEMMRFAKTKTAEQILVDIEDGGKKKFDSVDIDKLSSGNMKKGQNIEKAIQQRKKGEELLLEIQQEFMPLDTVLQKEDRRKITDVKDAESWEKFIQSIRK